MLKKFFLTGILTLSFLLLTSAKFAAAETNEFEATGWQDYNSEIIPEEAVTFQEDRDHTIEYSYWRDGSDLKVYVYFISSTLDDTEDDRTWGEINVGRYESAEDAEADTNQIEQYKYSDRENLQSEITGKAKLITFGTETSVGYSLEIAQLNASTISYVLDYGGADNNFYYEVKLSEEIGAVLVAIVGGASAVFVSTFDAVKAIFWDASANEGAGGLRWIAFVAILPVAFMLVRWSLRLILNMIRQRL